MLLGLYLFGLIFESLNLNIFMQDIDLAEKAFDESNWDSLYMI